MLRKKLEAAPEAGAPTLPKTAVEETPGFKGNEKDSVAAEIKTATLVAHDDKCRNDCPACASMWASKDLAIIRQNAMSNALQSPVLAMLVATKSEADVKIMVREYARASVEFVTTGDIKL